MPTLNIGGTRVKVDGSFLRLSPEDQQKTVDEIAGKIGIKGGSEAAGGGAGNASGGLGTATAASGGIINGLPVVGPYIKSGAEHAAALIRSWAHQTPYDAELRAVQGYDTASQAAHPIARTAGNLAGAVAGTAPLVLAAPAAFGAGGGGLIARSLASGATGTALGGADAAVRSGGDVRSTIEGAGIGGVTGGVAPGVGRLVGKGVSAIADAFARRGAAASAGLTPRAFSQFTRAARDDALTSATMGDRLSALGPDAMPMDLGPNLQRQAGAIAARPGPGQQIIRSAITDRAAGAGDRVSQALDTAIGQPVNTLDLADQIIARRATAARPLYEAAYAKPVPFTRSLEDLLTRPSAAKAQRQAQRLAADEGIPSKAWFANVADDGSVTIKNVPDVRQLDLTKRALDDMISSAQRAGNGNEARVLTDLKSKLVAQVDAAVPEYAAARQAYSGPSGVIDALVEGRKVFSNGFTPDQMRSEFAKMGDAEREAYLQGARAQIADIMGTARNDAASVRSLFQRGYNREKLALLIGNDRADQLLNALESETRFGETARVVAGNSETAARQAAGREIGGEAGPAFGVREGYMSGGLLGGARSAGIRTAERILEGLRGSRINASNETLARGLTGGTDRERLIQALGTVEGRRRLPASQIDIICALLLTPAGTEGARLLPSR